MNEFLIQVTEGHRAVVGVPPWFLMGMMLLSVAGVIVVGMARRESRNEAPGDNEPTMILPTVLTAVGCVFFVLGFFYK